MEGDGADVPPLEDMSDAFSKHLKLRAEKKKVSKKNEVLEVPDGADKLPSQVIEKLLGKEVVDSAKPTVKYSEPKKKNESKKSDTYCGFKKGFLTNKTSQDKKKPKERIVEVTKKAEEQKNVFPEVQDIMNQQMAFLKSNNEWMTEELLSKIMSHPKLSKQFMDPNFATVIEQFQTNPEHIMQLCKNNPEIREFIQDFCAIMGSHMTELGKGGEKQKSSVEANKQINKSNDEKKMMAILSDPEMSAILQMPEIQKLLNALKEDPGKAKKLLLNADVTLRRNIQKLIDVGLLQMAI